jgi:6-phosphogluconolactonase/glucosamine-6-phosphate isomerase/deaminase
MNKNFQIYKPVIFDFADEQTLLQNLTLLLEGKIIDTEADFGLVRLLLDGSEKLKQLYQSLSRSSLIQWGNIEIYQSDENYQLETLKSKSLINAFSPEIIELCHNSYLLDIQKTFEENVLFLNDTIDNLDGIFFDQAILTINTDGTLAGLTSDYLKPDLNELVSGYENKSGEQIITLNPESILNTKEISVVLLDDNASVILSELLDGKMSAEKFPAKILFSHPNVSIYFAQNE